MISTPCFKFYSHSSGILKSTCMMLYFCKLFTRLGYRKTLYAYQNRTSIILCFKSLTCFIYGTGTIPSLPLLFLASNHLPVLYTVLVPFLPCLYYSLLQITYPFYIRYWYHSFLASIIPCFKSLTRFIYGTGTIPSLPLLFLAFHHWSSVFSIISRISLFSNGRSSWSWTNQNRKVQLLQSSYYRQKKKKTPRILQFLSLHARYIHRI